MLRESYRLIRALPCIKNNRERLPVAKLLDKPEALFYVGGSLEKYCICTWIDESNGTTQSKEKYMPGQNVDLVRYIFAFDNHGKLTRRKEYKYTHMEKEQILLTCARNNSNLTINNINARFYAEIAIQKQIHCLINNTPY